MNMLRCVASGPVKSTMSMNHHGAIWEEGTGKMLGRRGIRVPMVKEYDMLEHYENHHFA